MNRECVFWTLFYLVLCFFPAALPNPILWHAVSGDTVILPCVTNTSGILNISRYKIYWQTEGRLVVHLLYNGKELPTQQYRRYHNRTKLFLDQLEHGNFSLMLSGIEPADEAVYICIAGGISTMKKKCEVKLNVSDNQVMKKKVSPSGQTQPLPNCPGNAKEVDILVVCSHLLMMLVVWIL